MKWFLLSLALGLVALGCTPCMHHCGKGCGGTCTPGSTALDQSLGMCQSPPIKQCAPAFILWNGQSGAQSFTPSVTGKLSKVRLRVSNPGFATSALRVNIVKGG